MEWDECARRAHLQGMMEGAFLYCVHYFDCCVQVEQICAALALRLIEFSAEDCSRRSNKFRVRRIRGRVYLFAMLIGLHAMIIYGVFRLEVKAKPTFVLSINFVDFQIYSAADL